MSAQLSSKKETKQILALKNFNILATGFADFSLILSEKQLRILRILRDTLFGTHLDALIMLFDGCLLPIA